MKVLYSFSVLTLVVLMNACVQPSKKKEAHSEPSSFDTTAYAERGFELVIATKQELAKNLVGAITEQGAEYAMEFCNSNATALTDSMSDVLKAKIIRVSDKPRNPMNEASGKELKFIEDGKRLLSQGHKLTPELHRSGESVVGYYPIITNALCLQCHGEPQTQILPGTLAKIDSLYPNDLAKGYSEDQLRGIWIVEME